VPICGIRLSDWLHREAREGRPTDAGVGDTWRVHLRLTIELSLRTRIVVGVFRLIANHLHLAIFESAHSKSAGFDPHGNRSHHIEEVIMTAQLLRHSLAWQIIAPIPLTVIAAIAAIWLLVPRMIADNATDQAVLASQNTAAQFKTIREYYTENVVDKIVMEGTFKASSDHKGDAKAIPLPVTMIHDLSALLTKQHAAISLYSKYPFPNRENRRLDAFEQAAWDFLITNPQEPYSRTEVRDGKQVVRVAVADTMVVQACVNCHNTTATSPKKDWKLGDMRGVLEITSVIDAQLANGVALSRSIIIGAILIGLLLLGITLVVAAHVMRPIESLIVAMQKFAAGKFETVLPGLGRRDEIGRLAAAFNNMVSELAGAREREAVDQARTAAMQAELGRVARLTTMGRMAASIAHEISQPLAAIVTGGNASLRWLAHAPPNLDEARVALNRIVKDGLRASDIIQSIRAIFRKGDEGRAPLDVNELIREVLRLTHGEIQNGRVSVETELTNELPNVVGNRVQLQLVFRNLIMNAVEAMGSVTDRGRVLHIRSEIKPSGVRIAVADSGTGIEPKSIDRIFDTFFTTKYHGMGMGLSISRSIVEAHGGQLSASPSHPHGSIFEIVLPAAKLDE
jgi:signal transduction histidine kinase